MRSPEVVSQRLCHGETSSELESAKARIFGELVRLAAPVLSRYHSDLYYDAKWLDENITRPCVFYYGVRDSGTHIGNDRSLIEKHSDVFYIMILCKEDGWWTLTTIQPGTLA